ncbi:MAG: AAA family ATPase [Verrucomicrobiae bacterium]|nr:AAA family ATPase [Verrucomicrobiae bacterium]
MPTILDLFREPSISRLLGRRRRRINGHATGVPPDLDSSLEKFDFIYPVQAHFGGRPFHRATASERIDLERLCREHADKIVRSDSRLLNDGDDPEDWEWGCLLFRFGGVFTYVRFSSNPESREFIRGGKARVVAHAPTPEAAKEHLDWIRKNYAIPDDGAAPSYFLLKVKYGGLDEVEPVPLPDDAGTQDLALHYGGDFSAWAQNFLLLLRSKKHGLSILRGEPGTGKTFFIRHLIRRLHGSHRFHFLPLKEFYWLSSPEFIDHWNRERKLHPGQRQVVVLEDAETLLMPRDQDNRGAVATLLNIADGLLGDYLKIHVICTINSELDAIDPAIKRPGRLMAMREFRPLSRKESQRLAESLGSNLPESREYTLAEVYNLASRALTEQSGSRKHQIGFANG